VIACDFDGILYHPDGPRISVKEKGIGAIITGRSWQEADETYMYLRDHGICVPVLFAPWPFDEKSRIDSAHHKIFTMRQLGVTEFFEDDYVQAIEIITKLPKVTVHYMPQNELDLNNERRPYEPKQS